MSMASWFQASRTGRALAAAAIVLSAGGLVLFRTSAHARTDMPVHGSGSTASAAGGAAFAGPGLHGTMVLSHANVLAGGEQPLFADVRLVADGSPDAMERAPLAMAVVLDTSGSMSGEKIEQAKDSCLKLLREMHDDDQISFVRYSDSAQVVQSLARVGSVRESLTARIRTLSADGGTSIPSGLQAGLGTLRAAPQGIVERVVLVSDGLDGSRVRSEQLAASSFDRGVTVSSLGIGLDFDESYMGAVALAGHGNFAFVQDTSALASFLRRELKETAHTTVENAVVRVALPGGMRLVRAFGADPVAAGQSVDLKLGAMYAGEERRVLLELATSLEPGDVRGVEGTVRWTRVGGGAGEATIPRVEVVASSDAAKVERGRDGAVLARAASVVTSERELEATRAYSRGEVARAQALIDQNMGELRAAQALAPAPAASALEKQWQSYGATKAVFSTAAPAGTVGKAHAKAASVLNQSNAKAASAF
jgi:Ca-activated chloride channel family protein